MSDLHRIKAPSGDPERDPRVAKLDEQLADLRAQGEQLEAERLKLRGRRTELKAQIDALEAERARLRTPGPGQGGPPVSVEAAPAEASFDG